MTQEDSIRGILAGFVKDPPDSEYQQGFLAAVIMIAHDVMGFAWTDPVLKQSEAICDGTLPAFQPTLKKAERAAFKVVPGGKPGETT